MRFNLILFFYMFFITACEDGNNSTDIRNSDDPMFLQMVAAFDSVSVELIDGKYSHFHASDELQEQSFQQRASYFYEILTMPNKKAVSLGCGNIDFCIQVLNHALRLVIDTGFQEERILMLPSYLKPPYELAEEAGVSIVLYDVPSF